MRTTDRRRHPRVASRLSVGLLDPDGTRARAETVDVSLGGLRVRSDDRIPVGPVWIVVDDSLSFEGEVLEELIDLGTGTVVARIAFVDAPASNQAELAGLAGLTTGTTRRRPRLVTVAAGAVGVLGILVVGGLVLTDDSAPADEALQTRTTAPVVTARTVPSTTVTSLPVPTIVATTVPAAAPATPSAPTPTTVASPPPAPGPTGPTFATSSEHADSTLTVTIDEDPSRSSGTSTVGPSMDDDVVRVHVQFEPEQLPDGSYPVSVTIENRDGAPITFGDGGAAATIDVRDGGGSSVTSLLVTDSTVSELAPGAIVSLNGTLRLEPGTYTLDAVTDVTRRVG